MSSVPEPKPSRFDPREPPSIVPPRPLPGIHQPPEIEPLMPDLDEPGRSPEETP